MRSALLVLFAPALALAAPTPVSLNHSGYVLDALDAPVEAPALPMRFAIWKSASSTNAADRVWLASAACEVAVRRGYYSTSIGTDCGAGLTTDELPPGAPRWLEVTIGTTTLTPRAALGIVASAAVAGDVACAGCVSAAELEGGIGNALLAAGIDGAKLADDSVAPAKLQAGIPANKITGLTGGDMVLAAAQTVTGVKTFAPATGAVPFAVAPAATGVVTNLNAEMLSGAKLFTLPFDCPSGKWVSGFSLVGGALTPTCTTPPGAGTSTLGTQANPATSCKAIKTALGAGATTSNYWIDPDGLGANPAFQVHCDMSTDNGGYTLLLHLKNPTSQIAAGALRDGFWANGLNLSTWSPSTFVSMLETDTGFVGWNRIKSVFTGGDAKFLVRGTNNLGEAVSQELYTAAAFNVNTANTTIEQGDLVGGGKWSVALQNDSDTRSSWGVCGTGISANSHVGFGLCTGGYAGLTPSGREVQVWHYGNWSSCFNVSLGTSAGGQNYTYPCRNAEIWIYVRE